MAVTTSGDVCRFAIAFTSSSVKLDPVPKPCCTPPALLALDGKTVRRLEPNDWICCWTATDAPLPTPTSKITDATPIRMPSMDQDERNQHAPPPFLHHTRT